MNKEYIDKITDAIEVSKKSSEVWNNSNLHFHLRRLLEYNDALFSKRFAPFQIDDKIIMIKTPTINKEVASGWLSDKHWMKTGTKGVVVSVDFVNNYYVADCLFDDESYINTDKEIIPIKEKHIFRLSEKDVQKLTE